MTFSFNAETNWFHIWTQAGSLPFVHQTCNSAGWPISSHHLIELIAVGKCCCWHLCEGINSGATSFPSVIFCCVDPSPGHSHFWHLPPSVVDMEAENLFNFQQCLQPPRVNGLSFASWTTASLAVLHCVWGRWFLFCRIPWVIFPHLCLCCHLASICLTHS